MVHPSRYSTSGVVRAKTLVVVHTSESPPTSAQSLLNAFERPGDRLIAGSNPPRYYGASYHAITMGDSTYRQVLGADCGPFAGPPRNKDAWHICMPGYANSTRAEWLTGMRREHIRGVARFLVDKAAGHPFPLVRIGPAELAAGGRGYCGHIDLRVYGQTDHYDPGPSFPWDVLAEDIEALTAPPPEPKPEPITQRTVSMISIDYKPGTPQWCSLILEDGELAHTSNGHTANLYRDAGVPIVERSTDQLCGILADRSIRAIGPCPFVEPVDPALKAAWDKSALGFE